MSRKSTKEDIENYANLSQIVATLYCKSRSEVCLKRILERDINVNYQVPAKLVSRYSDYLGFTALHFAYRYGRNRETIDLLLNSGADVTVKNGQGMSVLHYAHHEEHVLGWKAHQEFGSSSIDSLLNAQLSFGNTLNPRNNDGLSHLHIACTTNHVEAVEFFLANGEAIDQQVYAHAELIPGYGSLHIAVRVNSLDVAGVLLRRGADVRLKDASGLSPVHLCLKQNVKNATTTYNNEREEKGRIRFLAAGKKMMKLLVESCVERGYFFVDDFGLSTFHLACTLGDIEVIESRLKQVKDLNHSVGNDAPIFPGYTALHFAANSDVDSVICLVKRGADITTKDANDTSPFDICSKRYSIEDICSILKSHEMLQETLLSDGKTKLVDVVSDMRYVKKIKRLLKSVDFKNVIVPKNSQLWPGFTILHVAVALGKDARKLRGSYAEEILENDDSDTEDESDKDKRKAVKKHLKITKEILRLGADVTVQDARGSTPLHLAFHVGNIELLELLLRYHNANVNPIDKYNLSHLHIACATNSAKLANKLIANGADIQAPVSRTIRWFKARDEFYKTFFVVAGSTPLHVAVASRSESIVKVLLERGADLHAIDDHGMTPIHMCIAGRGRRLEAIGKMLMGSERLEDRVVKGIGLGHLHVACHWNDIEAVERLLDLGADIDGTINDCGSSRYADLFQDPNSDLWSKTSYQFLDWYWHFTPLHFVTLDTRLWHGYLKIAELLIERGADVAPNRSRAFGCRIFNFGSNDSVLVPAILNMFKGSSALRDRMKEEIGMTMLHVGCRFRDVDLVRGGLDAGEDVNARIRVDSPVFPVLGVWEATGKLDLNYTTKNCWIQLKRANVRFVPCLLAVGLVSMA